ncbi:uncharacterized protein BP5553_10262 [Venustampulla echinocandica]|uniref:Uncharacterized protein n=1 Tax=Venustampulla echinocandica TaxID=2656787 RepID=A0A370T9P6_9HELO|nr:uncharacterized protein BP5553_10262 [Venustampulla echinocandica]RDL30384.1 hypothetical protein BP5553_10262 [Venustampulla echinocandica]
MTGLLRFLLEYVGGKEKEDPRQHWRDPKHTANDNAHIYRFVLGGVEGPNYFGNFNLQEIFNALSKSPLFTGATTPQGFMRWSEALMAYLPVGFQEGYLGVPAKVLHSVGLGPVEIVRLQM